MGRKNFAGMQKWRAKLCDILSDGILWGFHHVPPGFRMAVGVPVMIGGFFGFLPILGFWMIPLGAALIALDVPPIRRRLVAWARRHRQAGDGGPPP